MRVSVALCASFCFILALIFALVAFALFLRYASFSAPYRACVYGGQGELPFRPAWEKRKTFVKQFRVPESRIAYHYALFPYVAGFCALQSLVNLETLFQVSTPPGATRGR